MEVVANNYLPGDQRLVDKIVYELKAQGIFDQFRKECFADVDTKPAYQNLRQRVEGSVSGFLRDQSWRPDMNKNQVREMLRKTINELGYLETGVERIVDQVVNPKINTVFLPKVEEVVYNYLGIKKPTRSESCKTEQIDLLPNDLEAVSPESEPADRSGDKSADNIQEMDETKTEEEESPPFEPLDEQLVYVPQEENSVDSHLSGFSGLISHESNQSNENKVTQLEQDSQMSRNSSDSRLSIVTSDENSKMDVSEDSQLKSIKSTDSNQRSDNDKSKHKSSDKHKSRSDSKSDKDRKSSKDSKSKHSSSSKDKERSHDRRDSKSSIGSTSKSEKSKDDKPKDKNDKDKNEKDKNEKDRKSSSSSSSKHSTSTNNKDKNVKKESSSSDKHKSDKDKDKTRPSSSSSHKDSKSRDKSSDSKPKEKSSSSEKHKHSSSSSSSHGDRHKKDKDKKKDNKSKDDHYSSKDKKNDRRSTDRDSNDGQSSKSNFPNSSSESGGHSSQTQKSSQDSGKSGGGDSGNSEQTKSTTKAPVIITGSVENAEVTISSPETQRVKVLKPKCASNIHEALKLRKIRKQLAKLEKQNQLSLATVEVNSSILLSSSIDLDSIRHNGAENEKVKQENVNNKIVSELEVVPSPLQNTFISQDNWDAMEAKLRAEVCSEFKEYNEDESLEDSAEEQPREVVVNKIEEDDTVECKYFEPVDMKKIEFLRFVEQFIKKVEAHKKPRKPKLSKRKLEDTDVKNNNKKLKLVNKKNTVKKSKEKFNSHADFTQNEKFSLPLSPAESEKSVGRKDETVLAPLKPKRNTISKVNNQRYSSDDLYKPRPTFISSRRRGAKNLEN